MANIRDVAERAGVSPITVSRVINDSGYVGEETRKRVEAAIKALNYIPNTLGRSLRLGRTYTLALVITNVLSPFWTSVARGVEDKAMENGFSAILCNSDEDAEKERLYIDVILKKQIDGVVIAPVERSGTNLLALSQQNIPYVVIDRRVKHLSADTVRSDSVGGAHQLVKHLVELGHRRIAIIAGPQSVSTAQDRLSGYRKALDESKIAVDPALIQCCPFDQQAGYEAALRLLAVQPRPTAIFAVDSFTALGTLKALREQRCSVPEDMAVVAFDDMPPFSGVNPFLTVAVQPAYEMGAVSTELLLKRVAGYQGKYKTVVLKTTLVRGQSSGTKIADPPPIALPSAAETREEVIAFA
jgi:LacI family transcriptional regulator